MYTVLNNRAIFLLGWCLYCLIFLVGGAGNSPVSTNNWYLGEDVSLDNWDITA